MSNHEQMTELQGQIGDITGHKTEMTDHEQMTELQRQMTLVSHRLTTMNIWLQKDNRALKKIIVDLQEENFLLREQLKDFQYSHMQLLADQRSRALQCYKHTYEEAHGISRGSKTQCDCSEPNDHGEGTDEVDKRAEQVNDCFCSD